MESFSFYQEIISCSSVTHCVSGYFAYHSQQLLLARHNTLELYEFTVPLKLICKIPLQGEVQSLAVLRHANQDNDLLIVACKEAKLITFMYNSNFNSFEALSFHSFENEKGLKGINILADPESRCLVGNVSGNKVFVLPTRVQDRITDEVYPHAMMGYEIYKPLFIIDAPINARSMVLIKGYTEPTLAVLHSPKPLQYPLSVKFFSLNLKKKDFKLLKETTLPNSTCHTLVALNPPLSGILVLSTNIIYYIGDNKEVEHKLSEYNLDDCVCELIEPFKLLILLCTGDFIMLGLNYIVKDFVQVLNEKTDAVETIMPIDFPYFFSAYQSRIKYCAPYLFVGSRIHDSFVFSLQQCSIKKEFEMIHEELPIKSTYTMVSFLIEKCDELTGIAGAANSTLFTREKSDGESVTEILITCGYGKNSYICKVGLSVVPLKFETFTEEMWEGVSEITGLFAVTGKSHDNFIVISKPSSTSVLKIESEIDEYTESTDFLSTVETLSAGSLGKDLIYQCYIDGIRILDTQCKLIRDFFKPSIWKVSAIGKKICILYLDGSIENFKLTRDKDELLSRIPGQSTSISTCRLLRTHILAVGRENGRLELYYMLTGTRVLCCKHAIEGPALITNEDTLDSPITDPCQKIAGLRSAEFPYITDLLISTYKDLMILCIQISTGQIFLYKSFETFKFIRIVTPLHLGPCEIYSDQKSFFVLKQGILVSHKFCNFWVLVNSDRRNVFVHPCYKKAAEIKTACTFNHPDCENGFIYRQGEAMEIGKFEGLTEKGLNHELVMVRKRCTETPRHILAHDGYIIVSFFTDSIAVMYHVKVFVYSEPGGFTEVSAVQQFSENEVIMAMCICKFSRKIKPPYEYLVIATGWIGTEDTTSQGRLILFSFNEGRLVYQALHKKPGLKGCCSALACIQDYLLVGVGSEFKIFNFVDEEGQEWLEPVAFYYGYTMSTGLDVKNSSVLCTDTLNQMYLLEYEEANSTKKLILKGQYFRELYPLAVSFHFNRQVVADKFRNLHIFLCHTSSDKIEKVGDLHTGLTIYTFCNWEGSLLMISQEGAISALYFSDEAVYKRVHTLHNSMLESLPNRGGLNERGYRLSSTLEKERQRKSVLDLSYVLNYCYLSAPLQRLIARNIGTVPQHVLGELSDLSSLFN